MYLNINTAIRKKINSLVVIYKSDIIPFYYEEESEGDDGVHALVLTHTNEPDSAEVGFNSAQQVTGYIQIKLKAPTSDSGLNYEMASLADQVNKSFPRSSFIDEDLKIEWLNVERNNVMRVEGHYCITMRVNYRIFSC